MNTTRMEVFCRVEILESRAHRQGTWPEYRSRLSGLDQGQSPTKEEGQGSLTCLPNLAMKGKVLVAQLCPTL